MERKQKQLEIYQRLADIGHALSNTYRLRMLSFLAHGERTVEELAGLTGQSLALASSHVKQLRANHLVITEKRGRHVFCRLANNQVTSLWLQLRDLGEVIVPEIREAMRDTFDCDEGLSPLTENELYAEMRTGKLRLLDLRPREEFEQGHIPTAVSIPNDDLASRMGTLPQDEPMLVYCRGPLCAMAFAGNRQLRDHQFRSQRLRFSLPEWQAAGLPIEC